MGRKKIKIRPIKDDRNRAVRIGVVTKSLIWVGNVSQAQEWAFQKGF